MSSQLQVSGEAKIRDIQGPVVANSGVITALDGAASQYVRGDGTLADFPTSTGGGSSVSYYLNSSVSQGTIGGVAYRELSKDPIIGGGTDIAISANGYVASYITDANDPDVTIVPGGNFNCEFYFSVNNNTGNPTTYAELYKYDGTTFTLLGTSAGVPESINQGTTIAPYYFAIPVATASLSVTDRLSIRIYVNVSGRTVTLHTENGHLCQVVTTLSKGMVSLNNLTDQSQYLATGTSGTNFNIVSSGDTHTFNLPVASATNTGKLSNTDWSTFNNKQAAGNYVTLDTTQTITAEKTFSVSPISESGYSFKILANGTPFQNGYSLISSLAGNVSITQAISAGNLKAFTFDFSAWATNTTRTYTLPNASGTIALTSDINYPVTSVFGRTGAVVAVSGDYTTTQVTEGTNLYFTDARARGALSFTAGSGAYNSSTGVITIPTNNNQITNGAGYITSSALSGYLPLTGGTLTGGLNGTTATFSGLGTFYQLTMTGATAGRIFYAQTGGVISQSGNLNWNETNGMLGVGTPNPTAVITAFSNNAATQFKASGNAPAFTFSESLTTSTRACVFGLATAANQFITGTAPGDMAIANQSTTAGAIVFGTGTAEKMRMSSSGNLGVGTASPIYKTHIVTANNTDGLVVTTNANDTETGLYVRPDHTNGVVNLSASGGTNKGFSFNTGNTPRLTIASTGAATFSSSVSARSGLTGTITAITTNDASGFGVGLGYVSGSYGYVTSQSASSPLVLAIDGGEKMRITTSGNVGIGTSSPRFVATNRTTLDINGTSTSLLALSVGGADKSYLFQNGDNFFLNNVVGNIAITTEAASNITFATGNTERMRISSGGMILMGLTSNPASARLALDAIGMAVYNGGFYRQCYMDSNIMYWYNGSNQASLTSAGVWTNASDISIKKDVVDIKYGLDAVLELKPRSYKMKNDDLEQVGFIAQEVEQVIAELVSTDNKGMKGLSYGNLTAVLVKAIQELNERIKQLENK